MPHDERSTLAARLEQYAAEFAIHRWGDRQPLVEDLRAAARLLSAAALPVVEEPAEEEDATMIRVIADFDPCLTQEERTRLRRVSERLAAPLWLHWKPDEEVPHDP